MTPPSSIAHYQITGKLGEGGMGAVYRATDTKLHRDVAVKVLPGAFAADAGRMARFEREAQVLAALNHPNIAAIYGIEQGALVMELVEGADLKGPVPADTALAYARQIAAGLEAAHERGIVHRDLKPANIKVTPDGVVKLLDFGLARAPEEAPAQTSASPTLSPTLSLAMTQAGMILGTAAYMSPEQARGKPVDKRADIWAFGVVLFELLTGSMLFGGETASDSMAAVIAREPDWTLLPKDTPPHLRRLLERCLRKDPKQRLRDIGDARILLEEPNEVAATPSPAKPRRSWLPWALAGVGGILVLALAGLLWRATRPIEKPLLRFSADLGPEAVAGVRITAAISPDGTRIAYPVQGANGAATMLATRLMDQSKPTVLAGTEGAADPFFSPDGQWIGFFADGQLRKVSIQGGAPIALCPARAVRGASWGEDGNIVFAPGLTSGLSRVAESGGTPQVLTHPPEKGENSHRWPQILPGGQAVLFTAGDNNAPSYEDSNIEVLFLKTGQVKVVERGGYYGRYLPSGHLVFVHQSTLFAVPFDLARYQTRGTPTPILEDIAGNTDSAAGQLDFSRTGTLVYLSGKSGSGIQNLSWLDAAGKEEPLFSAASLYCPRFSPDGKRLALVADNDIEVYDLARGSTTSLTTNHSNQYPVWTPDGKHIVYVSAPDSALWWIRRDGSGQAQKIYQGNASIPVPESFTPDGRHLAFHQAGADGHRELWTLPLDATDPDHPKAGAPKLFLATKGHVIEPAFSPDGQWLAYADSESGSSQVFVRPFPEGAAGGGQVQISTVPGRTPLWSHTAKELFYVTLDGHIMVVPYTVSGRSLQADRPREWSSRQILLRAQFWPYDLAPDGKRFAVFPAPETSVGGEKPNLHMTFLLNFFDYLERRVPVAGK